jgi:hypothetical protein
MENRDENLTLTWEWNGELSRPKLISFVSLTIIEGLPESDVLQAIIRLHGMEVYQLVTLLTLDIE